jgi:hypothetical protein
MRRLWTAGATIVICLIAGGVGAQSSSPEASPEAASPYAPDDLEKTLPEQVGSVTLAIESLAGTELVAEYPWIGEELLPALGKEPADMSAAMGQGSSAGGDESLAMIAFRINGVPAEDWLDPLMAIMEIDLDKPLPDTYVEWLELDEGRALVVTFDHPIVWQWGFRLKGEVLTLVSPNDGFTAEELLVALP